MLTYVDVNYGVNVNVYSGNCKTGLFWLQIDILFLF